METEKAGVWVEQRGNALTRMPQKRPGSVFPATRSEGRKCCNGWTDEILQTCILKLELYRFDWKSIIHVVLPKEALPQQVRQLWEALHGWLYRNKIGSLCIAETPHPHFHCAVLIPHCPMLELRLRRIISRWWPKFFGCPAPAIALLWESSIEPCAKIAPYLTKKRKYGHLVKDKAPWLKFTPYFTTRLPQREVPRFLLEEADAKAVLHPHFRTTFGAVERWEALTANNASVSEHTKAHKCLLPDIPEK